MKTSELANFPLAYFPFNTEQQHGLLEQSGVSLYVSMVTGAVSSVQNISALPG